MLLRRLLARTKLDERIQKYLLAGVKLILYIVTVLIVALALRHFYVRDRWAAQVEANARAEAGALQARIRPHFLFNSMNLIAGLLRRDPAVAERAVLDLSDLFRAALGAGEGESTLAAECELAAQYLSIEQLRLGDRL